VTVFLGDELKDLPTSRNVSSLMHLVPGITMQTGVVNADGGIVGGVGVVLAERLQLQRTARSSTPMACGRAVCSWTAWCSTRRATPSPASSGVYRRRDQRAGGDVQPLGRARRVGNRGHLHQHRPADRGQPVHRQLQHDLHAASVVRPEHVDVSHDQRAQSDSVQLRRLVRVRRAAQARPALVLLGRAQPGQGTDAGRWRHLLQPERREVGRQLPAGSHARHGQLPESLAERQHAVHVAGDAGEQVQHLLGRARFLSGSVRRHGRVVLVDRIDVVGAHPPEPRRRCPGTTRGPTSCSSKAG
jgi:hypothetical protein